MMKKIMKLPGNSNCADCGAKLPSWASLNLGVLLCLDCAGCHRGLGVHISKVRSVKMDTWEDEWLRNFLAMGGNKKMNEIYEARMKKRDKLTEDNASYREQFIRQKYEGKSFMSKKARRKSRDHEKRKKKSSSRRTKKKYYDESDEDEDEDEEDGEDDDDR